MITFLKAQAASFAGTAADFLITIFCVELLLVPIIPSGIIGNIGGAVTNFFIGSKWVFDPSKSMTKQGVKYAIVWVGYLTLNAGAMWVMINYTSIHYVVAKAIVGLTLAVTYNYFLQKKFVFN